MSLDYYNYYIKQLAAAVGPTDITITLTDVTNLPTLEVGDNFTLTLVRASDQAREIVTVTDVTGTVLTVTRAQEDTTVALAFNVGDLVVPFITAGMLDAIRDESMSREADLEVTTGPVTITDAHLGQIVEVDGAVTMGAVTGSFQCTLYNTSGSPVALIGPTLGLDLAANITAGGVVNVAQVTAGILAVGQMQA